MRKAINYIFFFTTTLCLMLGCKNLPDHNSTQPLPENKQPAFLNYNFNITKNKFNELTSVLLKEELIRKKRDGTLQFSFVIEDSRYGYEIDTFYSSLTPHFISDSLKSISLEFPTTNSNTDDKLRICEVLADDIVSLYAAKYGPANKILKPSYLQKREVHEWISDGSIVRIEFKNVKTSHVLEPGRLHPMVIEQRKKQNHIVPPEQPKIVDGPVVTVFLRINYIDQIWHDQIKRDSIFREKRELDIKKDQVQKTLDNI